MEKINIESISERFENHLKINGNFRIILSGRFGIGKTYFLNDFFKKRKDKYNTILLSPVNYVVSQNEDIFEIIKADIIYNLFFSGKIEIPKKSNTKETGKTISFFSEKPIHFVKFFTSALKKINPYFEVSDYFFNALEKLYKKYNEYSNKFNSNEENLGEFISSFWDTKANIFEQDFITQTINSVLKNLRQDEKKNVLIIDDLDRIDPEHIFRILNILSAHNNHFGQENKFSFDHVIIVCDIDNIRNIFYHKYGEKVDFEGYIDKFFSTQFFFFNNKDAIEFYVNSLNFESASIEERDFLKFIFNCLFNQNMTVRKLIKIGFETNNEDTIIYERSKLERSFFLTAVAFFDPSCNLQLKSSDLTILKFFQIVSIVYGDFREFENILKNLIETHEANYINIKEIKNTLSYLALQNHFLTTRNDNLFFTTKVKNQDFEFITFDWPTTSLILTNKKELKFNIQLKWSSGNIYNGNEPYFSNAKALCSSIQSDSEEQISLSEIFKILLFFAKKCEEEKLLVKMSIK